MYEYQITLFAVGAALALTTSIARADDRAIAQQVFQEARELMAAGKIAEACPKFAAAAQLSPTAGVRLNLSDCYAALGKAASAWGKADEALTIAERAGDAAAAELARQRKTALTPRLSYLTVAVAPQGARDLVVTLDGEKLPSAVWGTALPVDPGEHAIEAGAPGHVRWSTKAAIVGEAARLTVAVPRLEAEPVAAAPAAPAPSTASASSPSGAPPAEAPSSWSTQRTLALVTGGVGVVGLGVGAAFGLSATSKKSEYEQHQGPNGRCLDAACATLSQDALSAATGSTVGFIAGGALVAVGAVLWLTAPSSGAEGKSVGIVPSLGGASILGRF